MGEWAQLARITRGLPSNALYHFPSGKWGFVGRVDVRLAYCQADGTDVTDDQARAIAQFGAGMVRGVKSRAWDTAEQARAFLESLHTEG